MTTPLPSGQLADAENEVHAALKSLVAMRRKMGSEASPHFDLSRIHSSYRDSAANLLDYLVLRRHDIRPLQTQLTALGLSSLGRCERDVLGSIDRVLHVLERMTSRGASCGSEVQKSPPMQATSALVEHGEALFGSHDHDRAVRIMVTMPTEAAIDYEFVERLVAAGMNCQRINCAHDGPEQWLAMIDHVRRASLKLRKPCQVAMDLPGPKLRTGPIADGKPILKIRPQRDETGNVLKSARLYLTSDSVTATDAIQLPADWLEPIEVGDQLKCRDARFSRRTLRVIEKQAQGVLVELDKTTYLMSGLQLKLQNPAGRKASGRILAVPPKPQTIKLHEGDILTLTLDPDEGAPATVDEAGNVITPAHISCTSEAVFQAAKPGDPIWFDDGKIGGEVLSKSSHALHIEIHHAPGGVKLKADKGINLPDTDLGLKALGIDDVAALEFAARHADIVQLSFVNQTDDVLALFQHLERLDAEHLGVVLKIETRQGFDNLPQLLLAGMRSPRLGVMIARGDLAVETGFERTAELQEEMLCLCEAAHVPVIWATQVLESLAKTGAPTRAEITDAAMGIRAECVMLNKGPFILKAVNTLDDLLKRMQSHHDKKRPMLRKLRVAKLPVRST
ncbi:pyruvate kinase [Pseudomonas sp. TMB3-21]